MADFADYKDTLPKEPSSGKKAYSVGCANAADWQFIDNLLKQSGTSETNVPNDSVTVTDEKAHSQTRAVYELTDAEATALKNHPKVDAVHLNTAKYPGTFMDNPDDVADVQVYRYSSEVKHQKNVDASPNICLLYTSPSPRD